MLHLRCGEVSELQYELCKKGDSIKSCVYKSQLMTDSMFSNRRFFILRIIKVLKFVSFNHSIIILKNFPILFSHIV